jgi:AraC family transcriptional regulator of adaptative response/methylated-DNA-[protein]-cysteine methyltransferase
MRNRSAAGVTIADMKQIRSDQPIIEAQLSAGYESNSRFRDIFSRIIGAAPTSSGYNNILHASWLDTCLGPMIAIANQQALYLLQFVNRRGLAREIGRLSKKLNAAIIPGRTPIIDLVEDELNAYFSGKLQQFKTPLAFVGSPFQQLVWQELQKIPYGKTCSYAQLAQAIGKPSAFRAVAQANGANQLSIIIPCHRVINTSGELGGYSGGLDRKICLLNREKKGER